MKKKLFGDKTPGSGQIIFEMVKEEMGRLILVRLENNKIVAVNFTLIVKKEEIPLEIIGWYIDLAGEQAEKITLAENGKGQKIKLIKVTYLSLSADTSGKHKTYL